MLLESSGICKIPLRLYNAFDIYCPGKSALSKACVKIYKKYQKIYRIIDLILCFIGLL